jgi:glycosyltransferase involved in cell wall biosynthesis
MPRADGPRVAIVGMYRDPLGRDPDALLGGVWRDFGRTASAAQRHGARVTIVQAASNDAERDVDGVRCYFVSETRPQLPGFPSRRRLLERVAALRPEIIHYEGLVHAAGVRQVAAACPNVPILAQDHGTKCAHGWRRWWWRWGFAPLAGVAFTARAQAAPFVAARIFPATLPVFEVIEVSSEFTPGDQSAARAETGLDGDPCLLWAGNLDPNKDPLLVLDAVALAASSLPALRLHMYFRRADLRAAVAARIARDPLLAARVRLVGAAPHDRMESLLRAADFLVQASHDEGSGVAVIEALACGTTPIVTDIPSFRRITGEGRAGALVPVGDGAAFAAALRDWSARDRRTLRTQARAHFERALSFDAIGAELRAAYDAVR